MTFQHDNLFSPKEKISLKNELSFFKPMRIFCALVTINRLIFPLMVNRLILAKHSTYHYIAATLLHDEFGSNWCSSKRILKGWMMTTSEFKIQLNFLKYAPRNLRFTNASVKCHFLPKIFGNSEQQSKKLEAFAKKFQYFTSWLHLVIGQP